MSQSAQHPIAWGVHLPLSLTSTKHLESRVEGERERERQRERERERERDRERVLREREREYLVNSTSFAQIMMG